MKENHYGRQGGGGVAKTENDSAIENCEKWAEKLTEEDRQEGNENLQAAKRKNRQL